MILSSMLNVLKRPKLQLFIKVILSAFILFLLFKYNSIDIAKIKPALMNLKLMSLLVGSIGLVLVFNSYRWMKIINMQGIKAGLSPVLRFSLIGVFFNFLLPSSVGGDVVKAILAANQWQQKKTKLLVSIFVDRVVGLFVMMSVCLVGYLLNYEYLHSIEAIRNIIFTVAILVVLVVISLIALNFLPSIQWQSALMSKINSITKQFQGALKKHFDIILCIMMSLGSTFCHILFFILVFNFYNIDLPLFVFMFCLPIGTVATVLPISPAGIGVGQAVFFYMFNLFGEGLGETAFLAITILQAVYLMWAVIGLILFNLTPIKLKEVQVD